MSTPNQYWTNGMQMTADLKQIFRRVREKRPDLFVPREITETAMGPDGKVTTTLRKDVRAEGMSPKQRHFFSVQKR